MTSFGKSVEAIDARDDGASASFLMMSILGSTLRGAAAAALGTLAMDVVLYRRYRHEGGNARFTGWELSQGRVSWDDAPAPALVAKQVLERLLGREVSQRYARSLNNATHWGYGVATGAGYGLLAGVRGKPGGLRSGPAFGAVVWAGGYVVLPLFGVYAPIWTYDVETLGKDLGAHLVFGTTTAGAFSLFARTGVER